MTLFKWRKRYTYIEIVEESRLYGRFAIVEKQVKVIKARREEAAYLEAYQSFLRSVKMHDDLYKALGWVYTKPIGFKLLNQAGRDITVTIDFPEKAMQEKVIAIKINAGKSLIRKVE